MVPNNKLKNKKSTPQLAKFGLLGFYSDAKVITLDKDHVIKKVSPRDKEDFYQRTRWRSNQNYYRKYDYMLSCYYEGVVFSHERITEKRKNY